MPAIFEQGQDALTTFTYDMVSRTTGITHTSGSKSDNGSAFRAEEMKGFLDQAGAMPLYSPPHWPAYNGAIEAGIGSLKWRTQQQAARHGRAGIWTWDDVEAARCEANAASATHPWAVRTPVTDLERVRWELTVQRRRMETRIEERLGLEKHLDHWQQSAVDRKAIERALVEHGYIVYSEKTKVSGPFVS